MGHGGLKESQVVNRLVEEQKKAQRKLLTDENVLEQLAQQTKPEAEKSKAAAKKSQCHYR